MEQQDKKEWKIGKGKPGPGRPRKVTEMEVQSLAASALKRKYGSLEKAFVHLLESKHPVLQKLVFEYCFGRPQEVPDKGNGPQFPQINLQLVTNNNNNPTNEPRDNDNIPVPATEC